MSNGLAHQNVKSIVIVLHDNYSMRTSYLAHLSNSSSLLRTTLHTLEELFFSYVANSEGRTFLDEFAAFHGMRTRLTTKRWQHI